MSKYGVISGPYFPEFGLNTRKYGPEITPHLGTYRAVTLNQSKSLTCHDNCNTHVFFFFAFFRTGLGAILGLNTGKYGPEITPHLDTYHAVILNQSKSLTCHNNCNTHTFFLLFFFCIFSDRTMSNFSKLLVIVFIFNENETY